LIWTAKLNGINPQHYLTDVLSRIAAHPARQIAELLRGTGDRRKIQRAAA
jgi:transposase